MRILPTCLALVGTLFSLATASSDIVFDPTPPEQLDLGDLLLVDIAGVSPGLVSAAHAIDGTQKRASLRTRLASEEAEITSAEGASAVEAIQRDLQSSSSVLSNVGAELASTELLPEERQRLEMMVNSSQDQLQILNKHIDQVIEYLKASVDNSADASSETSAPASSRRLKEDVVGGGKDPHTTFDRSFRRAWDKHRSLFAGDGSKDGGSHLGENHLHSHMFHIQNGMLKGDHKPLHSFVDSLHQRFASKYGPRGTADQPSEHPHSRRLQSKSELCLTLATCASRMSLYDMFVYFYSDDIDPTTGEVDENIVQFAEKDFLDTKRGIKEVATRILTEGDTPHQDGLCDHLLRHFHRTIEHGNIPHWEGATVGQVCLAEGTTSYVKLAKAAAVSFVKPDTDVGNNLSGFLAESSQNFLSLIKAFAEEPIACAEEMFFQRQNQLTVVSQWTLSIHIRDFIHAGSTSSVSVAYYDSLGREIERSVLSGTNAYNTAIEAPPLETGGIIASVTFETDGSDSFVVDNVEILKDGDLVHHFVEPFCLSTDSNKNGGLVGGQCAGSRSFALIEAPTTAAWQVALTVATYIDAAPSTDHVSILFLDGETHEEIASTSTVQPLTRASRVLSPVVEAAGVGIVKLVMDGSDEVVIHIIEIFKDGVLQGDVFDSGVCLSGDETDTWIGRLDDVPLPCQGEMSFILDGARTRATEQFAFGLDGLNPNFQVENYRFPSALDTSFASRDIYGQLLGLHTPIFEYVRYSDLLTAYENCESDLPRSNLEHYLGNLTEKCIAEFFQPVDTALELVFGEKPSPGFICGIKDRVVHDGKPLPGTCCLDAAYQLYDDHWGKSYDCSLECQNPGPYFGGMSAEACEAQGGTFCLNPTDCSALQTCIEEFKIRAAEKNSTAFLEYLQIAPNVTDFNDPNQCGETREYFGFATTFVNDRQICADIDQLSGSRDFEFLNEFFAQGEDAAAELPKEPETPDLEAPPVPALELDPPSRIQSRSKSVRNNMAWAAKEFSTRQSLKGTHLAYETIKDTPCPSAPLVSSNIGCELVKFIAARVLQILLYSGERVLAISEFTRIRTATLSKADEIKGFEDVVAVFSNMKLTGTYLQERFQALTDFISLGVNDQTTYIDAEVLYLEATLNVKLSQLEAELKLKIDDEMVLLEESLNEKVSHLEEQIKAKIDDEMALLHTELAIVRSLLSDTNTTRRLAFSTSDMDAAGLLPKNGSRNPECQTPPLFDIQISLVANGSFLCLFTNRGEAVTPDFMELSGFDKERKQKLLLSDYRATELDAGTRLIDLPESLMMETFFVRAGMAVAGSPNAEKSVMVSFRGQQIMQ